jgi:hypothetical protein
MSSLLTLALKFPKVFIWYLVNMLSQYANKYCLAAYLLRDNFEEREVSSSVAYKSTVNVNIYL